MTTNSDNLRQALEAHVNHAANHLTASAGLDCKDRDHFTIRGPDGTMSR